MMSTSPCSSANIADDVLYGDDNNKFAQPVVNSTSPYLNHLSSTQVEVSSIVTSSLQSQTYKHFLAQKYAAESTSDGDTESHSSSVNHLSQNGQTFQQISNFYPFSPLVSSSSHFDTRSILGDAVLESSVDSLQVESSTNEHNSGHASNQVNIFNENITSIDHFIKQEQEAANLPITTAGNVTSSSNRSNDSDLCQVEIVSPNLFDSVNNDVTVDSTTTANISPSTSLNSSISSFNFHNFQSSTSQPPLSVLTYGLSPNFSSTLLQLDNSQPLLPSLPSPSIQIDQYFNHHDSLDKRDDNVILDQHQLLPSVIHSFSTDNQCLLSDNNLSDNFLHDIPNENYNESELVNENVISDLPVLSRARASLPIEYLYLQETGLGLGVFARKAISNRTQFGPIEGVIVSLSDTELSPSSIAYLNSKNSLIVFISETVLLSQGDENNSNWTRFVRPAMNASEQNLELITREFQSENELKFYFIATRNISPNEEMKVWYSKDYAERFNIKLLEDLDHLNLLPESDLDGSSKISLQNNNLTTGGHKLRNKIAKSQLLQMQQNQLSLPDCLKEQDQLDESINGSEMQDLFESVSNQHIQHEMLNENLNKVSDDNEVKNGESNDLSKSKRKPKLKFNETKTAQKYQCDICQRIFPRHYSLRRHQVMHSGEKRYKCPVCGMAFNHVYNRNRHLKNHKIQSSNSSEGNISSIESSCENSELSKIISGMAGSQQQHIIVTQSPTDLNHLIISSNDMIMNNLNNNSANVAIHNINNNNKIVNINSINDSLINCNSDSSSNSDNVSSSIGVQISDSKSQSDNDIKKNFQGKFYRCLLCYKRFSTQERLQKHRIVHDESAKHLSCNICKRKFLTNSALACHSKSHSFSLNEPRKYDCTLCGEVFKSIQLRREHVVVHINPQSGLYHCNKCPKTFSDFPPIRKHIKSFHSDEIFPCLQCEKVFPRQDKLRLHMLCHSDHWDFKCNFCEKQFKRKDKLKEHVQRMHAPDREVRIAAKMAAKIQRLKAQRTHKVVSKPSQANYHDFIYKCHKCLLGFKRRGMLVNHLAKRHPDVPYSSVPELNMPIVKTSKDYYCQYCDKVYKSSSKRKAHIVKNHPGKSLPPSNRHKPIIPGVPNPTFSAAVGSITINPHFCDWCHKQYASKAKLLQHQRKKHPDKVQASSPSSKTSKSSNTYSSSPTSTQPNTFKFNTIVTNNKNTLANISANSFSAPFIKTELESDHQIDSIVQINSYKNNKLDHFLSNTSPMNNSFIDNFTYPKSGDTYLNGNTIHTLQSQSHYPLDSTLEDLLDVTIVSDEHNQNLNLINNVTSSNSSFSNNIIAILACAVPSTCTTSSNDLNDYHPGISDIITQITSDYPNTKQLLSTNQSNCLSNETGSSDLMISESMEDANWNQVCEEMAIV